MTVKNCTFLGQITQFPWLDEARLEIQTPRNVVTSARLTHLHPGQTKRQYAKYTRKREEKGNGERRQDTRAAGDAWLRNAGG